MSRQTRPIEFKRRVVAEVLAGRKKSRFLASLGMTNISEMEWPTSVGIASEVKLPCAE